MTTILLDNPVCYFDLDFLFHPPVGWEVDLDRVGEKARARSLATENQEYDYSPIIWEGVIVRCLQPSRVWVLTGVYDEVFKAFEARWPD